jgi:hypothetical protein
MLSYFFNHAFIFTLISAFLKLNECELLIEFQCEGNLILMIKLSKLIKIRYLI